ncbi:MAG: acyl-CoA dehydrogenase family protein [Proteobacteria bacterium]|nr:acyl-CoA dehydrogenase family protein [Pseudomonadota bacterium]
MLDFTFTPEEQAMQKELKKLCRNEIRPRAWAVDRDPQHNFDMDMVRILAENEYLGMLTPEEYGGAGASFMSLGLATEELAYSDAGVATSVGICWAMQLMLILEGNPYHMEKYLPMLSSPKGNLAALSTTEPGGGSDQLSLARFRPGFTQTTAVRNGNHYLVNGSKQFTTNGGLADLYLVYATADVEAGHEATLQLLVEGDAPGISFGPFEDKMGQRASPTACVYFKDVKVPVENLYGEEGKGLEYNEKRLMPLSRGAVGLIAVGIARAAYDEAVKYARTRVQGGKPIIRHQAVSMMLADMATKIQAARWLAYYALWKNIETLGGEPGLSCMAKTFCSDVAVRVTMDAMQIMGGYGYMKDNIVEKLMRDAKLTQIYEGTNQICRLDLMEYGAPKIP